MSLTQNKWSAAARAAASKARKMRGAYGRRDKAKKGLAGKRERALRSVLAKKFKTERAQTSSQKDRSSHSQRTLLRGVTPVGPY